MSYFTRIFSCFGSSSIAEERRPLLGGTTVPPASQNNSFGFASDGPILAFNVIQKADGYETQIISAKKRHSQEISYRSDSNAALYTYEKSIIPFKYQVGGLDIIPPVKHEPMGDVFFQQVSTAGQLNEPGYLFETDQGSKCALIATRDGGKRLSFPSVKNPHAIVPGMNDDIKFEALKEMSDFEVEEGGFYYQNALGRLFHVDFKDWRQSWIKGQGLPSTPLRRASKLLDNTVLHFTDKAICVLSEDGRILFQQNNVETFYCQGNNLFYIPESQNEIICWNGSTQGTIQFYFIILIPVPERIVEFKVSPDLNFIAFVSKMENHFQVKVMQKSASRVCHEDTCDEFFRMDFTADSKVFYWAGRRTNDGMQVRKDPYMVNFLAMLSRTIGESEC